MEPRKTFLTDSVSNVRASAGTHDSSAAFDIREAPLARFVRSYFRQKEYDGWFIETQERTLQVNGYRFKLVHSLRGDVKYLTLTDEHIQQWMLAKPKLKKPKRKPNDQGVIDYLGRRAKEVIS